MALIEAPFFLIIWAIMLGKERKLYIEWDLIDRAARDKNFLAAIAFCVIAKTTYINSKVYNWSWRKLIDLCRCNLTRIKRAVREAYDNGLLYEEGKGLVCTKFRRSERSRCAVLHISYNDNGTSHIYIKSNCKTNKQTNKRQTISDIEDVLLSLGLMHGIGGYNHTLNTWLRNVNERKKLQQVADINRGVRRKNYDIIDSNDPSTNPFKRGYGLNKILKNVFENSISLYKLSKLIKGMKATGVLKVWSNYYKFADFKCDEYGDYERPKDMKSVIINHQTKARAKRNGSIYIEKSKSNENRVVYYRRMANGYQCTADYSHFKKNWKLINSKQNAA